MTNDKGRITVAIHIPAMRDAQAGSVVARVFTCSLFEDTLSMRDCVRQSPTKRQENLKALRIHANLFLRFQSVNHTSQKTGGDLIRSPLIEILRTLKLGRTQSSAARRARQIVYLLSAIILLLAAPVMAGNLISDRPIENRDAMGAFYSSLRLTESGEAVTRIIHYGDSHVAADLMTGDMRRLFHRGFGDAGTGFALAVRPWKWYSPVGGSIATSTGWRASGLSPTGDGRFGLAGMCASADRAEEWIRLTVRGRYFDIYLLKQPDGGAIDVRLDGTLIHERARLASSRFEPVYLEVEAESFGLHTIEIKISAPGPVRLFGIASESDIAGVSYDALGMNGARAYLPLAWDWRVLADNLSRRDPGLIIIAYGSNEAGDSDFDTSEYAKRFAEMLARFQQAAPDASILVISPPDRAVKTGRRWRSIKRLTAVVEAQRRAARAQGAAFWNLFEAMGGADSIDRWAGRGFAQADRVHLTRAGYRMVAEALYAELMRGYLWSLIGQAAARPQSDEEVKR